MKTAGISLAESIEAVLSLLKRENSRASPHRRDRSGDLPTLFRPGSM
ncbi:MAG: hypothetical protein JEZ04_20565 [Spirochaetales bacterium]|nr:hypothetical protein [Spirochaetales bacterium]